MEINSRCMGRLITLVITYISAERARKTVVGRKVKEKVVRKTYVSCVCVCLKDCIDFCLHFFRLRLTKIEEKKENVKQSISTLTKCRSMK